ncbi:MAG: hypothetical protein V3R93_00235 [Candidatus Hydrothermarchaeaceae archaeon]
MDEKIYIGMVGRLFLIWCAKMTELVMLLTQNRSDLVNALRMKSMLENKGVDVSGLVIKDKNGEHIPHVFVEDMMDLKIVGFIS